jgi:Uma2 family endonuclease
MMATRLKRKLGYVDYARLPTGDGKRYEVLDGELYVTPAPSPLHQRLSKRLQRRLEDYFEARGLGEVFNAPIDVVLAPHDIVEPDLVIVAEPGQISQRAIEGVPLLVAEVLSPSTRAQDRGIKMRRYGDLGVAHYWTVEPDAETIECWRQEGGAYRLASQASVPDVLRHPDWPDLSIDLAALWR